ncbi:TetR family transcriptional regulator [Nocardiopsis ansamitocini]|uniref:TetR family transcriptional regulator n=1 Tax=Nocardiopsis ansamitocini TaxID=1670832 RepID=A0A9W6P8U8_9ACTN|nr:TetR family transcriptional regulator [Nocardiopsis ansamitocini]
MAGVSHRKVAREAGMPTSASTYHFTSLGELLTAALTSVMEEDSARMRRLSSGGDRRRDLAVLLSQVVADPGRLLAEYELFLLAARRPHLRSATDGWLGAVKAFANCYTDDPVRVRVVAGAIDGLLLHTLLTDDKPSAEEFEGFLTDLLPSPGRS